MKDVAFIEVLQDDGRKQSFFKEEGQRFAATPACNATQTLKLVVDTKYILRITSPEELKVAEILVNGHIIQMGSQKAVDGKQVYEGVFSTEDVDPTKKSARDVLALQIPIQNSLQVPVQCKYYSLKKRKNVTWGIPLKNISVSYTTGEDDVTTVSALKFRKVM